MEKHNRVFINNKIRNDYKKTGTVKEIKYDLVCYVDMDYGETKIFHKNELTQY